jgi:hypothetical protein
MPQVEVLESVAFVHSHLTIFSTSTTVFPVLTTALETGHADTSGTSQR